MALAPINDRSPPPAPPPQAEVRPERMQGSAPEAEAPTARAEAPPQQNEIPPAEREVEPAPPPREFPQGSRAAEPGKGQVIDVVG